MKRLLIILVGAFLLGGVTETVKAQNPYTHTVKSASISAADTVEFLAQTGVVQFEYNFTETSGTTAGKVYLEGKFLSSWVKLDSVTLTDVATIQTLRVIPTQTSYKYYRFVNTNTSSATGTVLAGYLRRPGD